MASSTNRARLLPAPSTVCDQVRVVALVVWAEVGVPLEVTAALAMAPDSSTTAETAQRHEDLRVSAARLRSGGVTEAS